MRGQINRCAHIPYEVEDSHAIAYRRKQTGAIWGEEQVASAVDSA